jgi:serine recombinase
LKRSKAAADIPAPSYDPLLVGYVRVSTEEQNEEMQVHALARAGVHPENIYVDKGVSGAAAVKPARDLAVKRLRPGMTLVVWRLDRVSRSMFDLLSLLREMQANQYSLRSLNESIDTRGPMGVLMLHILGAFAQFERDSAQQRTIAGIARAKARGVRFGQPSKITPQVRETVERVIAGGGSVNDAAKAARIAVSTVRKWWRAADIERLRSGKKPKSR